MNARVVSGEVTISIMQKAEIVVNTYESYVMNGFGGDWREVT